MKTRTTYVVGGVRIPFMKSMTAYRDVTTPELMTASLKSLVERYNLKGKVVGDVALGALVIPPFLGAFKSRGHAACARRCFGV